MEARKLAKAVNRERRKRENEQKELLIRLVHDRPVLWDKNHKAFRNQELRDALWSEVSAASGLTKEEAKSKWKSLLDNFRIHFQIATVKQSGAGLKDNSDSLLAVKWVFFQQLMFLRDVVDRRQTTSNLEQQNVDPEPNVEHNVEAEENNNMVDSQPTFIDLSTDDTVVSNVANTTAGTSTSSTLAQRGQKRSRELLNDPELDILRNELKAVKQSLDNRQSSFGSYINELMNQFSEPAKRHSIEALLIQIINCCAKGKKPIVIIPDSASEDWEIRTSI